MRRFPEPRHQFFRQLGDGVIPYSKQFHRMGVDFIHSVILGGVRTLTPLVFMVLLILPGCGYRLAGQKLDSGRGRTIAVPTFTNKTTIYRLEQRLSAAVRRELIRRTRFDVVSSDAGDVIVEGEVVGFSAVPIIFNPQGRGTAYSILVDMSVKLTDTRTGELIFQNDRWTFREVFELAQVSAEYVPEDTAAMERLARRFASSLVSSMLHSKP